MSRGGASRTQVLENRGVQAVSWSLSRQREGITRSSTSWRGSSASPSTRLTERGTTGSPPRVACLTGW
jgi:hypothetical protein